MKTKEINENYIKELIEMYMDKPYEEINSHEIYETLISEPYKKIGRNVRGEIEKWILKELKEKKKLDDLHFKAAVMAGLVEEELVP